MPPEPCPKGDVVPRPVPVTMPASKAPSEPDDTIVPVKSATSFGSFVFGISLSAGAGALTSGVAELLGAGGLWLRSTTAISSTGCTGGFDDPALAAQPEVARAIATREPAR